MRYDKMKQTLELARALASSAEGMTLDEMCQLTGEKRRTVERMRDTIRELFPQMEEIPDHPSKRFRIPKGLDGFFQDPTTDELSDLGIVIAELRKNMAVARAESLSSLDRKVRSAMRQSRRLLAETDVEARMRAELIAVQAGPRPAEDPTVMTTIRNALLAMKMLRFTYYGGSTPGASREVIPFGIIFGRMNYLVAADRGTTKAKSWRLDKITDLQCLDETATPPPDFDLQEFADRSFGYFEGTPEDIVLHVLPSGMDDFKNYRFHSSQTVEDHPSSGGVIVRFQASGMLELAWHLFCWGNKIEIVGPDSLREQLTTELRVALAHHEEPLRFTYDLPIRKGS